MGLWKGKAGDLVDVGGAEEKHYRLMGYAPAPEKDLAHEALRKAYDHWYNAPLAYGAGAIAAIPGATAGISAAMGAIGPEYKDNFQQNMAGYQAAFPGTAMAGQLATGAAAFSSIPGVAGTAMGAEGLAAPVLSQPFLQTAAGIAAQAGSEQAAAGIGYKMDQAALEHANTPEGFDKIFGHVGMDSLSDFAIGAALGTAGATLPKAFRASAKAAQEWGTENMAESLLGSKRLQELERQGKATGAGKWMDANGLLGMPRAKASGKVDALLAELGPKFNEIKGQAEVPMPPAMQARFEQIMTSSLGKEFPLTDLKEGYTVTRLHQLRDSLDNRINWDNLEHPYNAKLNGARGVVDNYLNQLFDLNDAAQGGALANEWKAVNNEYSMAQLVKKSLSKVTRESREAGDGWWKRPAAYMLGSAIGVHGAAVAAGGLGLAAAYKGGRFGYLATKLATVFKASATGLAHAVEHGFYGLGPYAAGDSPADAGSYDLKAAQLRHIASDPMAATEKMGAHLLDQGYPQDIVDQMVQRQVSLAQALISKAPKSPYPATLSATPWSPDHDAKDHWADLYNTAHDIRHWIADPSPEKTQIAELAYPGLVQRTRDIISEQMSSLNDISMESRVWASNILGAPAEPLMNPQMFAILSMARQADDQPMQGNTPQPPRASSGLDSDVVASSQTGFERLQNRV